MKDSRKNRYEYPRSCSELVDLLMSDLTPEEQNVLARMTEDEFEMFYSAVGAHIVDEFKLWTGNDRLLSSCLFSNSLNDLEVEPGRLIMKKMRERVREAVVLVIIT